jgi:hypothetical protein
MTPSRLQATAFGANLKDCRMLAQTGGQRAGRACPLCPGISDINLFRYCQSVIDLNAEISDRAFDFGMPEQKLDGPEISDFPSADRSG